MTRTVHPGLYVDALPNGEFCVLVLGVHVLTHLGPVPFWPGETYGPMFLACTTVPEFKVTGLAHDSAGRQLEWSESRGWQDVPFITGRTAYDPFGNIRDLPPAGVQFVNDAGIPVSRIDAYGPHHGLSEWSETDGLYIGQGHTSSGVRVWDGSVLRSLDEGYCVFVRVHRDGPRVTVSYVKGGEGAVIVQTTLAELRALPVADAPDPDPVPDPEPDPMPDFPNYKPIVTAVRAAYPTPLGATHAAFLLELAGTIGVGAGLLRKDTGTHVVLPDGVRVAQDIICFPDGRIFDCLQDGEGAAVPAWGEADGSPVDVARYYAVSETPPPDDPDPVPDPDPDPDPTLPDYAAQIEELRTILGGVLRRLDDHEHELATLVSLINLTVSDALAHLTVTGTTDKTWSHTHRFTGTVTKE